MSSGPAPGWIVILNGAPRAGKSSIVRVVQATFPGLWMNLVVDRLGHAAARPTGHGPQAGR